MVSFIPRNSIFASDIDRQIKLFKQAEATINTLPISEENKPRVLRNIGVSIGCENVEQEMENVTNFMKKECVYFEFIPSMLIQE